MDLHGIIVAVATPPGRSSRGMIRASGAGAFALLRALLPAAVAGDAGMPTGAAALLKTPAAPKPTECAATDGSEQSTAADVRGEGTVSADDDANIAAARAMVRGVRITRVSLDGLPLAAIVACFPGPRSYTGEDVVELQLPGNPALLARAVDGLIAAGSAQGLDVRRAGPGEFTARAFFTGRLSLDQAEGVAATIAAGSDAELHAARLLAAGTLGVRTLALAGALLDALALVEAGIDFTDEEDVVAIAPAALDIRLRAVMDGIDGVLDRAAGAEALAAAPWVVLRGPPNAGKSTLFNALLGQRRSVVSMHAGTTRDVIIEPLQLPGAGAPEVMLADVAGEASSRTALERAMQGATAQAQRRADLVLRCVPPGHRHAGATEAECADRSAPGADRSGDASPIAPELVVFTKNDQCDPSVVPPGAISVSGRTGHGVEALRGAIAARLAGSGASRGAQALALQPRHETALREARDALAGARATVAANTESTQLLDAELVAASMREAVDALGAVTGAMPADDVLERIFAGFCIGK